jgi:hypothetical protein
VLTGQGAQHEHVHLDSATSSRAAMQPWPLQHLSQLQISHCRLGTHSSGGLLKLSALQQLPGLQRLELSHCQLEEVPAAVYACTALTQLSLAHNDIVYLNPQLASLQRLQVGCMFGVGVSSSKAVVQLCVLWHLPVWALNHCGMLCCLAR